MSALRQGRVLADSERIRSTHILSLIDPDTAVELGVAAKQAKHAIVRFEDSLVRRREGGFTEQHWTEIHAFLSAAVSDAVAGEVRLLVHCHHGQSRSPAVAYIAWALASLAYGPGHEREAFREVVKSTPGIWPNRIVVEVADKCLRRDGALLRPLEEFQAKFKPPSATREL